MGAFALRRLGAAVTTVFLVVTLTFVLAHLAPGEPMLADAERLHGDPERIARMSCRFGAMVFMPTELTLEVRTREHHAEGDRIGFELLNPDGGRAIRDGVVILRG